MEQLRVIGTEGETLVLATESGERFTLPVDDVLRAQLRQARRDRDEEQDRGPRTSPREIQSQIRAGLSAREVAELFGISTDVVARYEGPVLAEREHIVDQALSVPVLVADDFEHDHSPTFGAAVRAKLAEARATGERWTSWKEDGGWVVKLGFAVGEVDHDARWSFDPRRTTLSPANAAATQLSRQGSLPEGLIPRLRALEVPLPPAEVGPQGESGPRRLTDADVAAASVQDAAVKRAPSESTTSGDTADLLEALRRRRGQRDPSPTMEAETDIAPDAPLAPVSLFDAFASAEPEPEPDRSEPDDESPVAEEPAARTGSTPGDNRRKGRTSMPSWDEIVFGARSEDS